MPGILHVHRTTKRRKSGLFASPAVFVGVTVRFQRRPESWGLYYSSGLCLSERLADLLREIREARRSGFVAHVEMLADIVAL